MFSAVNCRDRDAPASTSSPSTTARGAPGVSSAKPSIAAACTSPLPTSTPRNPTRRRIGVVSGLIPRLPANSTSTSSPAWNGSIPNPNWNSSGTRNGIVPISVRMAVPVSMVARKVRTPNGAGSSSGCACRRRCRHNSGPATPAPAASASVPASEPPPPTPPSPTRSSARVAHSTQTAARANPRVSNGRPAPRPAGTSRSARAIAASPSGTLTQKIMRQVKCSARNPPSGGPSSGAVRPGQVSRAMARIRSGLAVVRSTASRPTGTIIAPPSPCSTRAATNHPADPAMPHSSDPSVNTATAAVNTARAPNRSAAHPPGRMNTATVSR